MSQFPSQFSNADTELLNNSIRRLTAQVEGIEIGLARKRVSVARLAMGVCLGIWLYLISIVLLVLIGSLFSAAIAASAVSAARSAGLSAPGVQAPNR